MRAFAGGFGSGNGAGSGAGSRDVVIVVDTAVGTGAWIRLRL
jgi:hypothetical protein